TGQEIATLKGHTMMPWCVAFSPNGKLLATGAGIDRFTTRGELKLWDVASRTEIMSVAGSPLSIWSVAFSPDGKLLASGGTGESHNMIKLWDVASRAELTTLDFLPE